MNPLFAFADCANGSGRPGRPEQANRYAYGSCQGCATESIGRQLWLRAFFASNMLRGQQLAANYARSKAIAVRLQLFEFSGSRLAARHTRLIALNGSSRSRRNVLEISERAVSGYMPSPDGGRRFQKSAASRGALPLVSATDDSGICWCIICLR